MNYRANNSRRVVGWPATLLMSMFSLVLIAQDKSPASRPVGFFAFHMGGLMGSKGSGSFYTFSAQQGVRINKVSAAIGLGHDGYEGWRVMPLSGMVGYDLFSTAGNSLFIQVAAGPSLARAAAVDNTLFHFSAVRGKYHFHPVVGYRLRSDRFSASITAGYKFQRIEYLVSQGGWWSGVAPPKVSVARDLERVSIQLGFGFN